MKPVDSTFKFALLLLTSCLFIPTFGQWAGSSSHAGTTKVAEPAKKRNTTNRMSGYAGIGVGGYTKVLIDNSIYENTPGYSAFNYIVSANYGDNKGFGYNLARLWPTNSKNLNVGMEFGGGYHYQDVDVQYYSYYDNQIINYYGSISSVHLGAGIPIRYNFVNTEDFKMYLQLVLGLGIVDVSDDRSNSLIDGPNAIFYGGGSLGLQISLFYIEVGANSTGYLRCGLAW